MLLDSFQMIEADDINENETILCEKSIIESNSTYIFYKILISSSYDIGLKVQSFCTNFQEKQFYVKFYRVYGKFSLY